MKNVQPVGTAPDCYMWLNVIALLEVAWTRLAFGLGPVMLADCYQRSLARCRERIGDGIYALRKTGRDALVECAGR